MSKSPRGKNRREPRAAGTVRPRRPDPAAATAAWNAYHQDPRTDKQTADALWTDMWSAVDFSWDGLADGNWSADEPHAWSLRINDAFPWQIFKRWHAPADFPSSSPVRGTGDDAYKETTLQDYWRWVPNKGSNIESWADGHLANEEELERIGLLLRRDGVLWHVAHLPWFGGAAAADPRVPPCHHYASEGDSHKALGEAIAYRMKLSSATTINRSGWGDVFLSGPDNRLQLSGTRASFATIFQYVIDTLSDPDRRKIQLHAPMAEFGQDALNNSAFGPSADFRCANLSGNLDRCCFDEGAHFTFASVGGTLSAFTFTGYSIFQSTAFCDHGALRDCEFEETWFDEATFGQAISFYSCTFRYGSFNQIAIEGSLGIYDAVFTKRFYASQQRCRGQLAFFRSEFAGGITLSSGNYALGIVLRDCRIKGKADFMGLKLGGESAITNNMFEDAFSFTGDLSDAAIDFSGSVFKEKALFRGYSRARFGGRLSFRTATFHELADFSDVEWPSGVAEHQSAFEGTRFRGVANFKTKDFCAFAMFDGASLEGRMLLTEPSSTETSPDALLKRALERTREAVAVDQRLFTEDRETWDKTAQERGPDVRFGTLAGGIRTLKRAMSQQGDVVREHRFYRFELTARQYIPSESGLFKVANGIYRIMSDYGYSITRPILAIVCSLLMFWMLYYYISLQIEVFDWRTGDLGRAWAFSWRNSFLPFSLLNLPEAPPTPGAAGAPSVPEAKLLAGQLLKTLGTLQSSISLAALFLFGLALRRRFQIG